MASPQPPWAVPLQITGAFVLAALSAMFSGLTLGLMGLDMIQLRVLMLGDSETKTSLCLLPPNWYLNKQSLPKNHNKRRDSTASNKSLADVELQAQKTARKEARMANRVYPLRMDGNYLLVTLLIGNVAVNSAFTLLTGDLTSGIAGFFISTTVITIFGEIIPQAVCSRFGLYVGSVFAPTVVFLEWLLFPIVKPLAWMLDLLLGVELGYSYNMKQLSALVAHHEEENVLGSLESKILQGGLKVATMKVDVLMKSLSQDVFYLPIDGTFSFDTLKNVIAHGYSRVPVLSKDRQVLSVLLVKDLLLIDPEDAIQLSDLVRLFGRAVYAVDRSTLVVDVLGRLLGSGEENPVSVARDASQTGDRVHDPS
eukprot:GHVN01041874.1.p1 GENE.GHVN01041874.1~~GHVN01041874.1.p1  ORF type:complete len:367 (-),score=35.93 GHVN01041874.1:1711-2811(-)